MLLLPTLPPFAGESTVSWCSRLASLHAEMTCADWLRAMQISRQSVVDTSVECVRRLSSLTGIRADEIEACGIQSNGHRQFRYRGETFGTNFAFRTHTTYCPACLLDDMCSSSPSDGHRVGRVKWSFGPVRSCEKHGVLLFRRPNRGFYEQFQDMNLVAPDNSELEMQAAQANACELSPLQSYIEARFHGASASEWLDGQSIDQASRVCEMLGACRLFGAHTDLNALTHAQWDQAGAVGFEAAQAGVSGICRALEEIAERSWQTKGTGGPQAALGRLYQWLQFPKSKKDPGPVRAVVREFILDTMAIDPGTKLFGEVVTKRRRHSVSSLADETGLHPKTLRRALVGVGLVPTDADANKGVSFDAHAGEKVASRMQNSLPVTKVPEYLNCNRTQADMLVRTGTIKQLMPGSGKRGGLFSQVAIEDLNQFLRQLFQAAEVVDAPTDGMVAVLEAAEIARETVADIIMLTLDGALRRVEKTYQEQGLRSLHVDPLEIKHVMEKRADKSGLTAREVGERLGFSYWGANALRKSTDRDGKPFLRSKKIVNARGSVRHRYADEDVRQFARKHVTLSRLAQENGVSSKRMMQSLRESGVEPILPRVKLDAYVFRRGDL